MQTFKTSKHYSQLIKKIIDWKWKPVPIARHQVSGSYETLQSGWKLILRVDVDGTSNLRMASFDFFPSRKHN